jgi:hypothetical protein
VTRVVLHAMATGIVLVGSGGGEAKSLTGTRRPRTRTICAIARNDMIGQT